MTTHHLVSALTVFALASGATACIDSLDAGAEDAVDAQLSALDGAPLDSVCDPSDQTILLCDDFNGTELDLGTWWYGKKIWGPTAPRNHGVVPENVSVHNGRVFFAANGDEYTGTVKGVRKAGGGYVQDQPGSRSGGIIASDQYLGAGRYEVRMKLPAKTGVASAIWTFHYQEGIANHEIDIEVPTSLDDVDEHASYANARYNTWIGEGETPAESTSKFFDNGRNLSDDQFHTWRFDWHTGIAGKGRRVDFYVDGERKYTSTTTIPTIMGRLTLGTWFPEWAGGAAPFDVQNLEVDWVRVTSFETHEDELSVPETYPGDGLTKTRLTTP